MNLLVSVAEGLGNVLQCLPLIWSLKKAGHNIDIWLQCNFPNVDKILELLTDCPVSLMGRQLSHDKEWYDGRIETVWSSTHMDRISALEKQNILILNDLNKQRFTTELFHLDGFDKVRYLKTEVQVALDIFRELEPNKKIVYTLEDYFDNKEIKDKIFDKCILNMSKNEYYTFELNNNFQNIDLYLLHNGYNFKSKKLWKRKTYKQMPEVINELQQMKTTQVGSIGYSREFLMGTVDYTDVSVYCLMALMLRSKCFISNDTGTYHLAAALGVQGITIFTFTNLDKNFDSDFHCNTTVIQNMLSCCPCQSTIYRDSCIDYKCRSIPSIAITEEIERLKLKGK